VEDVATIYEPSVGDEPLGHQPRVALAEIVRPAALQSFAETRGGDCLPTSVVEQVLVGVDDHMLRPPADPAKSAPLRLPGPSCHRPRPISITT